MPRLPSEPCFSGTIASGPASPSRPVPLANLNSVGESTIGLVNAPPYANGITLEVSNTLPFALGAIGPNKLLPAVPGALGI